MYAPQLGRFISRDPLPSRGNTASFLEFTAANFDGTGVAVESVPEAGLYGGVNLYEYVGSNPANETDPSGLDRYITGAAGHQGIAVDTWSLVNGKWVKTGIAQYDFKADYRYGPLVAGCWIGCPGKVTGPGTTFSGPVITRIPSSPFADGNLKGNLDAAIVNPPIYNLEFNNCRDFAQEHAYDGIPPLHPPIYPPLTSPPFYPYPGAGPL